MDRFANPRSTAKLPADIAKALLARELEVKSRPRSIAVYGASTVGRNLALALSERGAAVSLVDRRLTRAEEALHAIVERLDRKVERGLLDRAAQGNAVKSIRIGSGVDRLRGHDLVIEAGPTDPASRKESLRVLDSAVEQGTPIAAVVSGVHGYDLTDLSPNPIRVIPLHVTLPDFEVSVVEVIQAAGVAREYVVKAARCLEDARIAVVRAPGAPGFLLDRLALGVINEAVRMLDRGDADIEQIDRAMRLGSVHNVGPLQLADLLGLDYIYELSGALTTATGEGRYAPCPLLKTYVDHGYTGVKSGRGFYIYDQR